jgi:DNA-binding transcriptional ArsR family regulator
MRGPLSAEDDQPLLGPVQAANATITMDLNSVHQLKSQILFALAHPTRIAILEALREGEMSVGDRSDRLGLEQANCSQHLSILRAKEIVRRRRSANLSYYAIGDAGTARLLDEINVFIRRQVPHTVATLGGIDSLARKTKPNACVSEDPRGDGRDLEVFNSRNTVFWSSADGE